jgi:hypothetical protein
MERINRKPLQGVLNIVRFNWPFYIIAFCVFIGVVLLSFNVPDKLRVWLHLLGVLSLLPVAISLIVSWYIYDYSELYTLQWLNQFNIEAGKHIININAGFDEMSQIIAHKYNPKKLTVLDFYDPLKHTERSIARARKAYPPYPGTISISTRQAAIEHPPANYILVLFAAHEIRDEDERVNFFRQLSHNLADNGNIIVIEHLRNLPNFAAYNIGFFHFYTQSAWIKTFKLSGLQISSVSKVTPFLSVYNLNKIGASS